MRVEPKLMVVMILVVPSREKNICPSREHPWICLGLEQGGSRGALLLLLLLLLVLLGHTVKILLDIIIVAGAVVLMILLLHNGMIHHYEAPAALMIVVVVVVHRRAFIYPSTPLVRSVIVSQVAVAVAACYEGPEVTVRRIRME